MTQTGLKLTSYSLQRPFRENAQNFPRPFLGRRQGRVSEVKRVFYVFKNEKEFLISIIKFFSANAKNSAIVSATWDGMGEIVRSQFVN